MGLVADFGFAVFSTVGIDLFIVTSTRKVVLFVLFSLVCRFILEGVEPQNEVVANIYALCFFSYDLHVLLNLFFVGCAWRATSDVFRADGVGRPFCLCLSLCRADGMLV